MFDKEVLFVWFYGTYQKLFDSLSNVPNVILKQGMPSEEYLDEICHENETKHVVIIIDDMMNLSVNSSTVSEIYSVKSHHKGISTILILQNMFVQGKEARNIALNASYMCIFANHRDQSQIYVMSRQFLPQHKHFLINAYRDATKPAYGYLFLDFKQKTPQDLRVRTCIFPDDPVNYVYVPKRKE